MICYLQKCRFASRADEYRQAHYGKVFDSSGRNLAGSLRPGASFSILRFFSLRHWHGWDGDTGRTDLGQLLRAHLPRPNPRHGLVNHQRIFGRGPAVLRSFIRCHAKLFPFLQHLHRHAVRLGRLEPFPPATGKVKPHFRFRPLTCAR